MKTPAFSTTLAILMSLCLSLSAAYGQEGQQRSGASPQQPGANMARLLLRLMDLNNDGSISGGEYMSFFNDADQDKDGSVTQREVMELMSKRRQEESRQESGGPDVDQEAPDFTLKSLDDKEVKLSEFKGKVVLLHFFATFSKASKKQLPQMEKLHQDYKERGLVVIGITVETNSEKVQTFAKQNQLSYPILLNARKVFKDYKLGQIPDVCLINKEGTISGLYLGFNPCNEGKIEAEIECLLGPISAAE